MTAERENALRLFFPQTPHPPVPHSHATAVNAYNAAVSTRSTVGPSVTGLIPPPNIASRSPTVKSPSGPVNISTSPAPAARNPRKTSRIGADAPDKHPNTAGLPLAAARHSVNERGTASRGIHGFPLCLHAANATACQRAAFRAPSSPPTIRTTPRSVIIGHIS